MWKAPFSAVAVTGTLLAGAFPAVSAPLLPHRAVYDLALDNATDRSGITGLSGRMVYEFNGSACEGYTVKFRFVTQIDAEEVSRVTDQQTTTYEAGDGENFRFVTKSYVDQNLDTEIKGSAVAKPEETDVAIELPQKQDLKLERSQFPTKHLLELIGKANAGEKFYETTLYDGSDDGDKVVTTTVVIGKKSTDTPNDGEPLQSVAGQPFWPVDIAYFDMQDFSGEELPTYRISFKLYESGLTRDLVMDYGDFSISGKLVNLEMFDAPACAD